MARKKKTQIPTTSLVNPIADKDYEKVVQNADYAFVLYHASWCGPCVEFQPMYESVAEAMKDSGATFYKVDIDEQPQLAQQEKILSVPNILFYSTKVQEYFVEHEEWEHENRRDNYVGNPTYTRKVQRWMHKVMGLEDLPDVVPVDEDEAQPNPQANTEDV